MQVKIADLESLAEAIEVVMPQTEEVGENLVVYTCKLLEVWEATRILVTQVAESEAGS